MPKALREKIATALKIIAHSVLNRNLTTTKFIAPQIFGCILVGQQFRELGATQTVLVTA
jgi:hypothetical protein